MSDYISHTPGPWHLSECRSIEAAWETHEVVQVCALNCSHWSTDPLHDDVELNRARNKRMHAEAEANGRLIATAPDGYELAKMICSVPNGMIFVVPDFEGNNTAAILLEKARAIVAAVEGEKL